MKVIDAFRHKCASVAVSTNVAADDVAAATVPRPLELGAYLGARR